MPLLQLDSRSLGMCSAHMTSPVLLWLLLGLIACVYRGSTRQADMAVCPWLCLSVSVLGCVCHIFVAVVLQAAAVNTDTPIIVVLIHGGPLDVSWLQKSDRVDALLSAWHPGQVTTSHLSVT